LATKIINICVRRFYLIREVQEKITKFRQYKRKIIVNLILATKIINICVRRFYLIREAQLKYFLPENCLKNKYELRKNFYFRLILSFKTLFFFALDEFINVPMAFFSCFELKMNFYVKKKISILIF